MALALFRRSPHYTGFLAHPLAGLIPLLVGASAAWFLAQRPLVDMPVACDILVTALMLTGLLLPAVLFFPLLGSKIAELWDKALGNPAIFRMGTGTSWLDLVTGRELLAIIVILAYGKASGAHMMESEASFIQFDKCVAGLQEPGLQYLARNISDTPTARELSNACQQAEALDKKRTLARPRSVEDLKRRFGA